MGETLAIGSFAEQREDGTFEPKGTISFGSLEGFRWHYQASRQLELDIKAVGGNKVFSAVLYGLQGGNGGAYDFKSKGSDYWRGFQISKGVYASARDFGNHFAGYAAQRIGLDKKGFLRIAGAFNLSHNHKFNWILQMSNSENVWPTYGEKGISNLFQRLGYERVKTPEQFKSKYIQIFFSDRGK